MTDQVSEDRRQRAIRSFVKRTGRLTRGQAHALEHYWPVYGVDYQDQASFDPQQWFDRVAPTKLEIGFGNGDSLVEMAKQDPQSNYIGIEVHDPGVGHCLQQIEQQGVANLRLLSHDAVEVLQRMPAEFLDAVFLFFPDPWHKKRHHKRRIVNQSFRDLLIRVLKSGAVFHMATDWLDYAEFVAEGMLSDSRFANMGDDLGFIEQPAYRPTTKFERRGIRLGHEVRDLMFCKR